MKSEINQLVESLKQEGFVQQPVFHFGEMNHDLLHRMVFSVEEMLLALGDTKQTVKNVFSVLNEGLKNILIHGEKRDAKQDALIILATKKEQIRVVLGNYTTLDKHPELRAYMEKLNQLDFPEIKTLYQQKLNEGLVASAISNGLGIITMRLKSSEKIHYDFIQLTDNLAFFLIQADFQRSLKA